MKMKCFEILARVNGQLQWFQKYATCKRNAKKDLLDGFYWTTVSVDVEVVDIIEKA